MAEIAVDTVLKVMIVDDEQLVRQGLRMTVDWGKHQMTVVADSANGLLGWESFQKHRPHIVITDIVMPEMDGIELAKRILKIHPETKILFLSCHRDFSFAKQGIQLGISDYIVKTNFDDAQMDESLAKIRQELVLHQQEHASVLTQKDQDSRDNLLQTWLMEKKQSAAAQLKQHLDTDWKWTVSGGHVFHLFMNKADDEDEKDLNLLEEVIQTFPIVYDEGILFLKNGRDSLFLFCGSDLLNACKNDLLAMKLNKPWLHWRSEGNIQDASGWMMATEKMHRLRQIETQIELRNGIHKDDVLRAIDFIDQHLHLDIRAADLANRIGVSRSYFSTIFKEEVGCSLITFISDRKLKRAKDLLRLTDLRTDEIAEQVGIQDAKYFSKWFKKCVAQTPSLYRHQTK
ncbi:two-component system, response regulator YesN [Paenibacillus sp. 1_12]|uniref:response regulator transcription factor n=1 Tax=Paenibacillus sp. 1_12 TaxID=1566278 RepID=UPI0008EADDDE|nr:response regulator [Paenibacillus sp. 1_12]SFK99432.1 two-component system, response regulator YesN [Paenibacillus sp. 1_12]